MAQIAGLKQEVIQTGMLDDLSLKSRGLVSEFKRNTALQDQLIEDLELTDGQSLEIDGSPTEGGTITVIFLKVITPGEREPRRYVLKLMSSKSPDVHVDSFYRDASTIAFINEQLPESIYFPKNISSSHLGEDLKFGMHYCLQTNQGESLVTATPPERLDGFVVNGAAHDELATIEVAHCDSSLGNMSRTGMFDFTTSLSTQPDGNIMLGFSPKAPIYNPRVFETRQLDNVIYHIFIAQEQSLMNHTAARIFAAAMFEGILGSSPFRNLDFNSAERVAANKGEPLTADIKMGDIVYMQTVGRPTWKGPENIYELIGPGRIVELINTVREANQLPRLNASHKGILEKLQRWMQNSLGISVNYMRAPHAFETMASDFKVLMGFLCYDIPVSQS